MVAETDAVAGMAHLLPTTADGLIGRDEDIAALGDLLSRSQLVTVVGPAGMGKTRLAAEAAARLAAGCPDGAWYVDLSGVVDDDGVIATVRAALSLTDEPGRPSSKALAWMLRDRLLLLVLDHGDHVRQAVAELAGALRRGCPQATVLVAAEEPLGGDQEAVWTIPPLSLPAPGEAGDATVAAGSGAVRLFVDRARRQRPDFALTAQTAPAVAGLCRRMRGVPLAIEVAAGATDLLAPADIARRLRARAEGAEHETERVPAGEGSRLPDPDDVVRAALDCIHGLLPDAEQTLWARLAVFAGGCTAEAAAEVCGGDGLEPRAVPGVLDRLAARCLAVVDAGASPRYRLLHPVRQRAAAMLDDADETVRLQRRHRAWCVALAERAEPELTAGDQRAWLARLDEEHANLRAALVTATRDGDGDVLVRLAGALVLFWAMRGRFHEGRRWLEATVAVDAGTPRQRATVRWGAALMARALGHFPRATTRADDALALGRHVGDPRLCARALGVLGAVGITTRDHHREAMEKLTRSLGMARQAGDAWSEAGALAALGAGHLLVGDAEAGRARFRECLAVADRSDDPTDQAHRLHALVGLGRAEMAAGETLAAERHLRQALVQARGLGIPVAADNALRYLCRAMGLHGDEHLGAGPQVRGHEAEAADSDADDLAALGRLALSSGDTPRARRLLQEARALADAEGLVGLRDRLLVDLGAVEAVAGDPTGARTLLEDALAAASATGDERTAARARHELGHLARAGGDDPRAVSLHHQALVALRKAGDGPAVASCLESLGGLAARQGDPRGAGRLLGAAAVVRDACAIPRRPLDQPGFATDVTAVRRALDATAVATAWRQGAEMALDDLIATAPASHG